MTKTLAEMIKKNESIEEIDVCLGDLLKRVDVVRLNLGDSDGLDFSYCGVFLTEHSLRGAGYETTLVAEELKPIEDSRRYSYYLLVKHPDIKRIGS